MPELAEVEYARKLWDPGAGARVTRVLLHPGARIFRGIDSAEFIAALEGTTLLGSEARAKQMLFRFGKSSKTTRWLGMSDCTWDRTPLPGGAICRRRSHRMNSPLIGCAPSSNGGAVPQ